MTDDINQRSPKETRRLLAPSLEPGFTALATALQEVGLVALACKASDSEITAIQALGPLGTDELQRITEAALINICKESVESYVAAARRALRFDEQEDSDG
jgi:hypothetical protein